MKKYISILILLLSTNLSASTLAELKVPSKELFKFVKSSQILKHERPWFKGGFPVSVSRSEFDSRGMEETNIFVPLQMFLALDELNNQYEVPGLEKMIQIFNPMFEGFLKDTKESGRPEGTINFWPRLTLESGKEVFHFTRDENLIEMTGIPSLDHDFDDSSHVVMWMIQRNLSNEAFIKGFLLQVGEYVDLNRKSFPFEFTYKDENSGTFLTWVRKEKNFVDLVVNLNIINAISLARNKGYKIPAKAKRGELATCKLVDRVIKGGVIEKAMLFYSRMSQFALSFARVLKSGGSCLTPKMKENLKKVVLKRAGEILREREKNFTEVSEVLISLKSLNPIEKRGRNLKKVIIKMENLIKIEVRRNGVLRSGSLFNGNGLYWYSDPQTSVLGMQGLLLK